MTVGPELPVARTLAHVLRTALTRGSELRLLRCTGGPVYVQDVDADYYAYVRVVVEGVTLKVPRLAGSVPPAAGGPAYLLAAADFLLYIGTVKRSP